MGRIIASAAARAAQTLALAAPMPGMRIHTLNTGFP